METTVDERGRVLIPLELRRELGLDEGVVVNLKRERDEILIARAGQGRRPWKELNGLKPTRTAKPEWPTPEEIKGIWE
ncbi:MAG: AbrB/MazE/SpoVT family DNA-binding domain-containing protein [Nitrososphaerales archaeon]|nr:AbrB/MazE/SpoVT family DNA-binding domain-containing protein [Nitrososphaerales archaeon]